MRTVIISETNAKNTSYIGSMLPKYLSRCGAEVHVITSQLFPYYYRKDFKETYSQFGNLSKAPPYQSQFVDGYTVHTLPYTKIFDYVCLKGIFKKLKKLSPDIVYSLTAIGWLALSAAIAKVFIGYRLFTGSHTTASTFPLASKNTHLWNKERLKCFITRFIHGRFVSLATEKCYAPTKDCAEIAWRFFGVQKKKVSVIFLGVDRDYFFPINSSSLFEERKKTRSILGFRDDEIVCIYTGKMSEEKNPAILAETIDCLKSNGFPYRGLFIGSGVQSTKVATHKSCVVLNFMPYQMLAKYYRASDIGVWPTNESTSMLDAAACGIPLIVSDGIVYREHVNGNGVVYHMNNRQDLFNALLSLQDVNKRKILGCAGAEKMARYFCWESIAQRRMKDFEDSLNRRTRFLGQ
jgi:glycosyltransferase involved in cell wall biosynthesis